MPEVRTQFTEEGFRELQAKLDQLEQDFSELQAKSKKTGESFATTANQAAELAGKVKQAAASMGEFVAKGAEAVRVARDFEGDLDGLKKASGNAVDETTLQQMDIAARRMGLWAKETEAFTRVAAKFRKPGQSIAEMFETLGDASPEQLEKLGILTSDLIEELKGLDTVQQKQVLRQAIVAEGMQITNEEVAAMTHEVEIAAASWDNFVSDLQVGAAELFAASGAGEKLNSTLDNMKAAISVTSENLTWFANEMAKPWGKEDVGVINVMDLFWEQTVIGPINQAIESYLTLERLLSSGAMASVALGYKKDANAASLNELQIAVDAATLGTGYTRNAKGAERAEWWYANDGFNFDTEGEALWQKGEYASNRGGGRKRRKKDAPRNSVLGTLEATFLGTQTGYGEREGGALGGLRGGLEGASGIGTGYGGLDVDMISDGLSAIESKFETHYETIASYAEDAYDRINASMEANHQFAVSSAQGLSDAFVSSFSSALDGADSFRDQMADTIGVLWGQLSAGFLAWATAEGNLLAGNPFGAIAAATALGVVGAAISKIAKRGGRSSSGAGGGNATVSRRAPTRDLAPERPREERRVIFELTDRGRPIAQAMIGGTDELMRMGTGERIDSSLVGTGARGA